MEQVNNDNIYVIDLGELKTAPEVIFELSSILDKEESHNRRICLKLGEIDLNQAQLLSIKSLINGIDSNLSGIETKSEATEKTALSLGIIINNSNSEKADNINDAMPYKTIEEFKEEQQTSDSNTVDTEEAKPEEENNTADEHTEEAETIENTEIIEEKYEEESGNKSQGNKGNKEIKEDIQNNVEDELEVIFGSNPVESSIFEMEVPKEIYEEEKEGLTDVLRDKIKFFLRCCGEY